MRLFLHILLIFSACVPTLAQDIEDASAVVPAGHSQGVEAALSSPRVAQSVPSLDYRDAQKEGLPALCAAATDSLRLPAMNLRGQVQWHSMYPVTWGGWYNWDLHKGLNVSIGASVFAQFGKSAHHGVGFSQNISMMYAAPLSGKLSVAVGGYFNNTNWLHDSFRDAGMTAALGYRFDEHWEAYLYGQKSLTNNYRMPLYMYDISNMGDRIGVAVRYNFNNHSSIQISVEANSCPAPKRYSLEQPVRSAP